MAAHQDLAIDGRSRGRSRDTCAAPWDKWVEGIIPTSLAFPVHPNANGMAAVGKQVAAALAGTELAGV